MPPAARRPLRIPHLRIPHLRNRWAVLALLVLARTAMGMQFQSLAPLAPRLMAELALDFAQLGTLIGLFMLPGSLLSLPGGLLGARLGDKPVLVGGLGLMVLGSAAFAASDSFADAAAARLLVGAGGVLVNVLLAKITTDWFAGRELATAQAIQLAGWPVGMGIALGSAATVAGWWDWRAAILATSSATALPLLLTALFYRPRGVPREAAPDGSAARPVWWIPRRAVWLSVLAGGVWASVNGGLVVFLSFTPSLLAARGLPMAEAGRLVGLAMWVFVGTLPLGGYLVDRSGRSTAFIAGGSLLTAGAFALLVALPPAIVWIVLYGLCFSVLPGAIVSLPAEVLRSRHRSTGFGWFYGVYYLVTAASPAVAGYLRDAAGSLAAAALFGAVLSAAAVPALLAFRIAQRRWLSGLSVAA